MLRQLVRIKCDGLIVKIIKEHIMSSSRLGIYFGKTRPVTKIHLKLPYQLPAESF
jgi:hypothetical protein